MGSTTPTLVVLVKHTQPILEAGVQPGEWRLAREGEQQSHQLAHLHS